MKGGENKMVTIEELERQLKKAKMAQASKQQKIRIAAQSKREMAALGRKKAALIRELRDLKSPKKTALKKGLVRGGRKGAIVGGKLLKGLWEAIPAQGGAPRKRKVVRRRKRKR